MAEILASQGGLDERGRSLLEDLAQESSESQRGWRPRIFRRQSPRAHAEPVGNRRLPGAASLSAGDPGGGRLHQRAVSHRPASCAGGLGEVFLAVDPELDRQVALEGAPGLPRATTRSARRGSCWRPGSPGGWSIRASCRSMDWGDTPTAGLLRDAVHRGRDPRPCHRAVPRRGELLATRPGARSPSVGCLRSLIDACNAVAYAHSRGVVHRDLKPDNIMLGRFGETLVVDWGLAKALGGTEPQAIDADPVRQSPDDSPSLTRPGSALGTPQYMSPEQASGDLDRVGPASDVYSLGATLYCLLVGHGPFSTGGVADVIQRVRRGIFPAPRRLRRSIDPALEATCLKAMSVNPEDRHATPTALAEEIEAWLADVRYRAEHDQALGDVKRSLARPGHRAGRPPLRARDDRRGDALAGPRPGERPARFAGARPRRPRRPGRLACRRQADRADASLTATP